MTTTPINANELLGTPNIQDFQEERCSICQEEFNDIDELYGKTTHKLEECGHKFHTNCIISWFRQTERTACPNCGDCGVVNSDEVNSAINWRWHNLRARERFSLIRRYSKRKNAPQKLKTQIDKISKMEKELKEYGKFKKDEKNRKQENISIAEAIKLNRKLSTKRRMLEHKISKSKRKISHWPIIPIIIPKVKYVERIIDQPGSGEGEGEGEGENEQVITAQPFTPNINAVVDLSHNMQIQHESSEEYHYSENSDNSDYEHVPNGISIDLFSGNIISDSSSDNESNSNSDSYSDSE